MSETTQNIKEMLQKMLKSTATEIKQFLHIDDFNINVEQGNLFFMSINGTYILKHQKYFHIF